MTAPTLYEVITTLLENADFEENSSIEKAKLFITAAKQFLILSPSSQSSQGGAMSIDTAAIKDQLATAQQFVNAARTPTSNTNARVRFFSLGDFR